MACVVELVPWRRVIVTCEHACKQHVHAYIYLHIRNVRHQIWNVGHQIWDVSGKELRETVLSSVEEGGQVCTAVATVNGRHNHLKVVADVWCQLYQRELKLVSERIKSGVSCIRES